MNVVINGRLLRHGRLDGIGWFTHEITQRLVHQHPEHTFHIVVDRHPEPELRYGDNVRLHRVLPPARRPILYEIWYQYTLPRFLSRLSPDLFVSTDGFIPLNLRIPTVNVQHDLGYLAVPDQVDGLTLRYYTHRFPQCFRAATCKAAVSEFSRMQIAEAFSIAKEEIAVIPNAARAVFAPVNEQTQADIRMRYTGGEPYLVFVGTVQPRKNIEGLFQVVQQLQTMNTNIRHLVIAGRAGWNARSIHDMIETMGLSTTVHFTGYVHDAELAAIVGSAAAMVYLPHYEGFGIPILEAMASGVPVLCSQTSALPEVAGSAALYVDHTSPSDVAQAVSRVEHDTSLRADLVGKGLARAREFSWDASAEKMWLAIERAVQRSTY